MKSLKIGYISSSIITAGILKLSIILAPSVLSLLHSVFGVGILRKTLRPCVYVLSVEDIWYHTSQVALLIPTISDWLYFMSLPIIPLNMINYSTLTVNQHL